MDINIDTCPFCGGPITVHFAWKYGWYSCGCFNRDCLIRPVTHNGYLTEDEAIDAWNKACKERKHVSVR